MIEYITGPNILAVIVIAGLVYGGKLLLDKRKARSAKGGSLPKDRPGTTKQK